LIPSSTVKKVPHFGHFTFVSFEAYRAQPRVKAAINAIARTKLISFFTPLHLLSFIDKNPFWGGLNIQKRELYVKVVMEILTEEL
jgi:trehalose-6-phosphate synthase